MSRPADSRPLVVAALSGGMDSTTLLAYYAAGDYRLLAVSVDYGQRHGVQELRAARAVAAHFGAEHRVLDLRTVDPLLAGSALPERPAGVPSGAAGVLPGAADVPAPRADVPARTPRAAVPSRVAVLANLLLAVALARRAELVALGRHPGGAAYPDCRSEFVTALTELIRIATDGFAPPRIDAPFVGMTKTDIVRLAARLDAPLHLSWSCYRGAARHCGACSTCYERREAFRAAGVPDPADYDHAVGAPR